MKKNRVIRRISSRLIAGERKIFISAVASLMKDANRVVGQANISMNELTTSMNDITTVFHPF